MMQLHDPCWNARCLCGAERSNARVHVGAHCGKLLPQNDRRRKAVQYSKYYFHIQSVELFRDGHSVCAKPPICFSALMRITTTPPHEDSGMATRLEPGIVQGRHVVGKLPLQ
jgi:hypothetical protein